jgi:hypothetical protein
MGELIKSKKIFISTPKTLASLGEQPLLISGENIKTINGNSLLGSGDLSIAVNTANKIYVDSTYGVNATGAVNDATKPYLTVEYVLANVVNTGTLSVTTVNTSATITAASTTGIAIGQYLTGTGIPYNSIVVSFVANTSITISQPCTASATVTGTWWTPYELVLSGNFTATSNWSKAGFFINAGTSNISWGNFDLFSKAAAYKVPEYIIGGNWYGNHAGSRFIYSSSVASEHDINIDINTLISIGTGTQIFLYNAAAARNITINANSFEALNGTLSNINCTNLFIKGYHYGYVAGITVNSIAYFNFNGYVITYGTAITTISTIRSTIEGRVVGSINLGNYNNALINASVNGTSWTSACDELTVNGEVRVTTGTVGGLGRGLNVFNGNVTGDFTCTGTNTIFKNKCGNFIAASGNHELTSFNSYPGNAAGTITISGTANLTINNNENVATYTYYALSVASGSKLTINGYLRGNISSLAGRIINNGTFYHQYASGAITGIFENYGYIELTRDGHSESAGYTPCLVFSSGIFKMDGGTLKCAVADSKSGLIRKTASGGKIIFKGQPYLKVANGLAPIQILSNTGTAQDVYNYGVVDNCASGFQLADTFSDTTYGTAYAPNMVVNLTGCNSEAATNDF